MLSVKWVLTNKGTPKAPVPKARLVAREFASNALDRDTLFSGTKGLANARSLISKAATCRSSKEKLKVMLLNVTAAFLYGDRERPLFMELPQEYPRSSNPNLVARLTNSLNETRDAPQLWGEACREDAEGPGLHRDEEERQARITIRRRMSRSHSTWTTSWWWVRKNSFLN